MIIPCIDLMGGRAVQLVQGRAKALETAIEDALESFRGFPLLHVIDLDAALGLGSNRNAISKLVRRVRARVGGGIRSVEAARALIEAGADQVIVGSAAFDGLEANIPLLQGLVNEIGTDRVMTAIDCIDGRIAVQGWRSTLDLTPAQAIRSLEPYCGGFLCTSVDREGLLEGTDLELFMALRSLTERTLVAAGGITTLAEIDALTGAGIEVALGMAVYTGKLNLAHLRTRV